MSNFEPINEIVKEVMQNITLCRNGQRTTGITTGFDRLDYLTGGFQSSDLIVIAAIPSMGKTYLMLNLISTIALKDNTGVAVFSLEDSKKRIVSKLAYLYAGIKIWSPREDNLSDEENKKLSNSLDEIGNAKLYVDDTCGITIQGLSEKCKKLKKEPDIKIIFIDYLQLMNTNTDCKYRAEEVKDIVIGLKELAKELDIPIVVLSQLPRTVEQRPDHRPMIVDMSDSSRIEEVANLIMFVYRENYYNREANDNAEIIIAKNSNGPIGPVELKWLPEYGRFENPNIE